MAGLPNGVIKQLEQLLAKKTCTISHIKTVWKYEGKWLRTGDCHYKGGGGKERVWEMTERTTKKKGQIDGVDIIATIGNNLSLVAVYRPPVEKISIEFPAGLINEGEAPSLAAIRELKEETGQDGTCQDISTEVFSDPWKSNESSVVCQMNITGGGHEQCLDEDEFLEHFQLPLEGLMESLNELKKQFDVVIESKLYLFALGLNMGKRNI